MENKGRIVWKNTKIKPKVFDLFLRYKLYRKIEYHGT